MENKFSDKEKQYLVIGLKLKLDLSQNKLGKEINLVRQTISRYESLQRIPNEISMNKIFDFIKKNKFDFFELVELGKKNINLYKNREIKEKLKLKKSEELAELIGIILGDGEVKKDGSIRISFDPKKDENFLNRRIKLLIKNLLNQNYTYESKKRIHFGNIAFIRYLNIIGIKAGSKFINNWKIPEWCETNDKYRTALLRGIFDTDGYFGYVNGSVEIMLGRFSEKSKILVYEIHKNLKDLGIKNNVNQSNDKRYKIRIYDQNEVIKFFRLIGSSNLRNITRFLLWRIERYEAKIEKEGLENLIIRLNKVIHDDIKKIILPFKWNQSNKKFIKYINLDLKIYEGSKIRNEYEWSKIINTLVKIKGMKNISKSFNITERSIRKWIQGTRVPSKKFILDILKMLEVNKIDIKKYKR